ncbi:MAG: fibrobacter succinogenes major paralogous domain-containing protein [Fibrobacter sp.]|nr:fibrobacter succinogenes major paralogous domain-containing protein [Fibrobacter sp.]
MKVGKCIRVGAFIDIFFMVGFLLAGCSESFTDERNGQSYNIVEIGGKVWMASNLNFETAGSFCPDGEAKNCKKFGRLYTWAAAMKACPEGWRLPYKEDYESLVNAGGGAAVAGSALKSGSGWFKKGNGTNMLDFGVLPAGYRGSDGKFDGIGGYGYLWTATSGTAEDSSDENFAFYLYLDFSSDAAKLNSFDKADARSVRCVRNP